jgi:DNA-directed RNA polymerase subunit RPC12/RpoP
MKVVCAWCSKTIKEEDGKPISHGICTDCKEKILKEEIKNLKKSKT